MDPLVNFKIFLVQDLPIKPKAEVQPSEVRRFSARSPPTYAILSETIEHYLPNLKGTIYSIHWMDNDGDFINVTSDAEMLHAIHLMIGQLALVKFYVVPKPVAPVAVHHGVTCDSCQMAPITGTRYKCFECPDYDLCQTCEQRGVHNHHDMARCVKPLESFPFAACPAFYSRHAIRRMKKESRKRCSSVSSESDDPCLHKGKKEHCRRKRNDEEKGHRRHRRDHHHEHHRAAEVLHLATNKAKEFVTSENFNKTLNDVSNVVCSALSQLQTYATANPTESASTPATGETSQGQRGGSENNAAVAQTHGEASAAASASIPQEDAAGVSASTSAPALPPQIHDIIRKLIQPARMDVDPVVDLSDRMAHNRIEQVAPDWTMVNPEPSTSAQQQQPASYPDLQIQKGLEILEAMGFNNSNGAVARILESFNGDLYKTLDALIPKRKV